MVEGIVLSDVVLGLVSIRFLTPRKILGGCAVGSGQLVPYARCEVGPVRRKPGTDLQIGQKSVYIRLRELITDVPGRRGG
jgi:hypothetical protein